MGKMTHFPEIFGHSYDCCLQCGVYHMVCSGRFCSRDGSHETVTNAKNKRKKIMVNLIVKGIQS